MNETAEKRNKSISIRTTATASSALDELANRIDKISWRFHWTDPMRDCGAKSGIIHHVIAQNLTLKEIQEKLLEMENVQRNHVSDLKKAGVL